MSTIEERVREIVVPMIGTALVDHMIGVHIKLDRRMGDQEDRVEEMDRSTRDFERDTATVTRNLKESIGRLEQSVKEELLAARERIDRLAKDLGDRSMTLGEDSPAYPTKPAELQQRVINATLKASAEGRSPSEAAIREVAEWLRRENYLFSARELLAQLEP